jgi:L-asparaginase II
MSEVLAHVIRGGEIESVHRGHLVVVDKNYQVVFGVGEPHTRTYWRSAAKPFQVLPMIEAGGIEKFGFDDEEIAVMTASHGGEEKHVERVRNIFDKMGCELEALDCGRAAPMYWPAAKRLIEKKEKYGQIHNPCSGKHSSMIALALVKGYDIKNYIDPDHPVQREMLGVVSDVTGLAAGDIGIGVDGCGVPVFGLPVYNMAVAYSKLAAPRDVKNAAREEALSRVAGAMTGNPFYVAGSGRLDTLLMEATSGRLVAKLGAEGVYCIGVIGEGVGIALKIEDGSSRAIDVVITELLNRLGLISEKEYESIRGKCKTQLRNHREDIIGEIRAVF